MSNLQLRFQFHYYSTLSTRQQILVVVFFTLNTGPSYRRQVRYDFFTPLIDVENRIRHELDARAQSATNRWALQFRSADAAADRDSYDSLTEILNAIAWDEFSVADVSVRNIVAETPKRQLALPPAPPPPPKSRSQQIREDFSEEVDVVQTLRELLNEVRSKYPELADDPEFGLLSRQVTNAYGRLSHHDGLLMRRLKKLRNQVLPD
jgi:hypothetical protein